jgi:hypothetical protein
MIVGGGEQSEIIELPILAKLARQIDDRPVWLIQDRAPIVVDPATFKAARDEMKLALQRQGRPLSTAPWIDQENFLLRGIPVVMNG